MNEISCANESINPWKKRELFPSVSKHNFLLAVLAVLLSAIGLGLCAYSSLIAPVLSFLLFAYVVYASRSYVIALMVLLSSLPGAIFGFAGISVVLSLIVGAMSLAYLLSLLKRPYISLLLPMVGVAVTFAVTGQWQQSLLSLAFVPAAILLAFASVSGSGRTSVILFAQMGFLITVVAMLALLIYNTMGGIGREQIFSYVNGLRDSVTAGVLEAREELIAMFAEASAEQSATLAEQLRAVYNESLVATVFTLLPAVAVMLCAVLAFNAQTLLGMHYLSSGFGCVVTRDYRVFTMSVTASVIYTITFLLSFFISPLTMAGAVILNISWILMPGFLVIGIRSMIVNLAHAKGGFRLLLIFFFVAVFCCSSGGLSLIAAWGAYDNVISALHRKISEKIGRMKGDDRSDGSSDE